MEMSGQLNTPAIGHA